MRIIAKETEWTKLVETTVQEEHLEIVGYIDKPPNSAVLTPGRGK